MPFCEDSRWPVTLRSGSFTHSKQISNWKGGQHRQIQREGQGDCHLHTHFIWENYNLLFEVLTFHYISHLHPILMIQWHVLRCKKMQESVEVFRQGYGNILINTIMWLYSVFYYCSRPLQDGDIISVDVSVSVKIHWNWHRVRLLHNYIVILMQVCYQVQKRMPRLAQVVTSLVSVSPSVRLILEWTCTSIYLFLSFFMNLRIIVKPQGTHLGFKFPCPAVPHSIPSYWEIYSWPVVRQPRIKLLREVKWNVCETGIDKHPIQQYR